MQKFCLLTMLLLSLSPHITAQHQSSQPERDFALRYFHETKASLLAELAGLTPEQLVFKSAPDHWSIAECAEHITLVEIGLFQLAQAALQQPADAARRAEIKVSDQEVIARLTNRNFKAQAPEQVKPTGKFPSTAAALEAFQAQRDKAIDYMTSTTDDLHHHFAQHPAVGTVDIYQYLLLMAAHGMRHTLQIQEIKTEKGYPK